MGGSDLDSHIWIYALGFRNGIPQYWSDWIKMNAADYDRMMRGYEIYRTLTAPDNTWLVIRCDGRNFHKVTANLEKPFDATFNWSMTKVASALLDEAGGIYAEHHSDECSILLAPNNQWFGREVQKLASVSAGISSATYSAESEQPAAFDTHIVVLPSVEAVVDYFSWRQADAETNCLSAWSYWLLRKAGRSAAQAQRELHGVDRQGQVEIMRTHGCRVAALPDWQRLGTGIVYREWTSYADIERTKLEQRRTTFPLKHMLYRDEYRRWIAELCERYVYGAFGRVDNLEEVEVERWTNSPNGTSEGSTPREVLATHLSG